MALDAKTYADKGVQANLNATSSEQHQNAQGLEFNDTASNTIEHSTASRSDDRTIVLDAAYTYPGQYPAQLGPSRSPPASRRICKHPQLPYSRPSQATNLEKRVVSLPDAPQMQGSSNLTVPTETLRVVSLPGTVATRGLSGSPATTENNSSIEYLDTSADTSSYRSSRAASVHRRGRNFPPSDMPSTPSPPSSPESILIIGNDHCLPRSFLRPDSLSPASVFSTEDDAGWITWAGSPPRPIPALHGPLSLPYARCPSGAEGTIIEDADLPRMIWGLDLDDTNLNVNPARNASAPAAKIQPSRSDIGAQYISSKPALRCQLSDTLSNYPHSYGPPDRKAQEYTPLALKTPAPANYAIDSRLQGQNSRASYSRIPHRAWNEAPIQLPGPLTQAIYEKTRCGNSGVDWSDLPSQRSRNPSGLKSSAPTFVPSHQVATPVVDTQSCIFVEPRAEAQITPERRLSAIEIAQRYRVEQQQQMQAALPTPPNSSWPIWSPTFSTYAPSPVPPQGRTFHHPQQPSPPHQYYTSGPIPVSGRDFSEELRQIEAAKRELGAIIGLQGVAVSDNNVNATSRTTNPPGVRRQDGLHRPSPAPIDMSLILKHHSNVSLSDTSNFLMPRPNVPVSTPQPRHPLGQRPQTIPMTHLVQRRLSSVREEDAPFSSQTDSPLVHVSAGMSFSQNTDLGANEVHESRRMSRSDGKVAAGRLHVRVEGLGTKQDDDKENKTGSGKETNTAKPTPKKKWRPRKKSATAN